jgi:malate dehydrogenase (oxaloacetate-decarboxylating)(NADP+)
LYYYFCSKAVPLLAKYRDKYRCFNDDIQGTGSVTLAGIMSAARVAGCAFTDMRFLCAGAGSAGLGVCTQIVEGLVQAGLTKEEARSRFVVCSVHGAIGQRDGTHEDPHYAHKQHGHMSAEMHQWVNPSVSDGTSLLDVVKTFKPTVLLGLTAQPNVFSEEIVREMASYCPRPVILPMSNPTHRAECTAEQAYTWTDGRAIVATGSPFAPVTLPDGRVFHPSQCNNMYIFPGIGLAASVGGIRTITDRMLYEASLACANATTAEDIAEGRTFPHVRRIRDVSLQVACAVIREGLKSGQCTKIKESQLKDGLEEFVFRKMYNPHYVPLL